MCEASEYPRLRIAETDAFLAIDPELDYPDGLRMVPLYVCGVRSLRDNEVRRVLSIIFSQAIIDQEKRCLTSEVDMRWY